MSAQEAGAITLDLLPESHDTQIAELIHVLQERGIKNALSVLSGMKNPHLEDDFHRFIVEFIKEGYEVKGLKHGSDLEKILSKTLYEVALPNINEEGDKKSLKELVSVMEQFYAGMLSIGNKSTDAFTLELANSHGSEEFVFYASVPDEKRGLFEKQVVSMFPHAKLTVTKNDYNVFSSDGVSIGASASFAKNPIYPLRTYETFDADPLSVLLNAFSKIDKDGEGAAIQFVIRPATEDYVKKYKNSIDEIHKGKKVKDERLSSKNSKIYFSKKMIKKMNQNQLMTSH
jgi:hypothetical protein